MIFSHEVEQSTFFLSLIRKSTTRRCDEKMFNRIHFRLTKPETKMKVRTVKVSRQTKKHNKIKNNVKFNDFQIKKKNEFNGR